MTALRFVDIEIDHTHFLGVALQPGERIVAITEHSQFRGVFNDDITLIARVWITSDTDNEITELPPGPPVKRP